MSCPKREIYIRHGTMIMAFDTVSWRGDWPIARHLPIRGNTAHQDTYTVNNYSGFKSAIPVLKRSKTVDPLDPAAPGSPHVRYYKQDPEYAIR
jgi:hypothetical protein